MPGTFVCDTGATFATMLLMSSGPKTEFGSAVQAISKTGEKKWFAQVAATWQAEYGMRPVSEVIEITLTGGDANPAASIQPGSPVEFVNFRIGVSSPEMRDNGRGPRVSGGRAWYSASAVRASGRVPVGAANGAKGD